MNSQQLIVVLVGCLVVGGCHRYQFGEGKVRPLQPPSLNARFIEGIGGRIGTGPVRILAVHGIFSDTPTYSEPWQEAIARKLDLQRSESSIYTLNRGYEVQLYDGDARVAPIRFPPSTLHITRWRKPGNPADQLVFYALYWVPGRNLLRDQLIQCFETGKPEPSSPLCPQPAPDPALRNSDGKEIINAAIKSKILVEGFSDAAILLSPAGDMFRDDVDQAMCVIARDALNGTVGASGTSVRCEPLDADRMAIAETRMAVADQLADKPFFAITASLGSFLVMDGQQRSLGLHPPIPLATSSPDAEGLSYSLLRNASVYMFANQVALLELGRIEMVCANADVPGSCPTHAKSISRNRPAVRTTYVAFNDRNDLLGLELPPYLAGTGNFGRLVNVSVNNPSHVYSLKEFLIPFFAKSPTAAHTNQAANRKVVEAIVNGLCLPLHFEAALPADKCPGGFVR